MLALVAPSTMSAEQQTLWLAAAVDSLEDIRADEVHKVSAEVRRSVQRHNQIVPKLAELVARNRAANSQRIPGPPLPEPPPRLPAPPMSQEEIDRMPKWMKEMGLRVGFLKRDGNKLVEAK
jgi:hypothetical protein